MFIRNETFSSFIRNYPVVSTLIALTVLIHFITVLPFGSTLYSLGIGFNLAISYGEYWRLVTPIFLHAGLFHLLFNMGALLIFGPAIESMVGKLKFIFLYLLPGTLANVAVFLLQDLSYMHVGASGSIYGLFGVILYVYLYRNDLMDQQTTKIILPLLIIGLIMTFLNPQISTLGHLFGLLFGLIVAPLFLKGAKQPFIEGRSRIRKAYIDDDDVSFNPDRWKNRERNKKMKIGLLIVGIILFLGFVFIQSLP